MMPESLPVEIQKTDERSRRNRFSAVGAAKMPGKGEQIGEQNDTETDPISARYLPRRAHIHPANRECRIHPDW